MKAIWERKCQAFENLISKDSRVGILERESVTVAGESGGVVGHFVSFFASTEVAVVGVHAQLIAVVEERVFAFVDVAVICALEKQHS